MTTTALIAEDMRPALLSAVGDALEFVGNDLGHLHRPEDSPEDRIAKVETALHAVQEAATAYLNLARKRETPADVRYALLAYMDDIESCRLADGDQTIRSLRSWLREYDRAEERLLAIASMECGDKEADDVG